MMFNLVEYLSKYTHFLPVGDEWVITCPICHREKLVVNISKNLWHCWVCQEFGFNKNGKKVPIKGAGNIVQLVMLMNGISYSEASKIVQTEDNKKSLFVGDKVAAKVDPYNLKEIPFPPFSRPIVGTIPYCEQRGITQEDIKSFGLFYCDSGRYKNRLIFPVWENGRLVFFQGRAMWEEKPGETYIKSLNPPKVPGGGGAEDTLFNLDYAKFWPRVVITEGPIDAIHVGRNAVCTWGKRITDIQILKLYHSGIRAVDLMWDGPSDLEPNGAFTEMIQAVPKLSGLFDVRVVFLPEGDPGQYSRNELSVFLNNARNGNEISSLGFL